MQTTKLPLFSAYFLVLGCASTLPVDNAIIDAWNRNDAVPLAHVIDETLTIERAYQIQSRIVRKILRTERPAGFKAGLTSSAAQARFRTSGPVAGVLTNNSTNTPRRLQLSRLRGLHLETEVAFRVGKPISSSLKSTEELKAHIDGIAPALELPNLDYEHANRLDAVDIVASNVAAAYFLLGEFEVPQDRDPNRVSASLECEGQTLSRGQGRDAMGDQWTAALWLVNTAIEQGWTIAPGQVLLTGALGQAIRAQPGRCAADFGDWGHLQVEIVP